MRTLLPFSKGPRLFAPNTKNLITLCRAQQPAPTTHTFIHMCNSLATFFCLSASAACRSVRSVTLAHTLHIVLPSRPRIFMAACVRTAACLCGGGPLLLNFPSDLCPHIHYAAIHQRSSFLQSLCAQFKTLKTRRQNIVNGSSLAFQSECCVYSLDRALRGGCICSSPLQTPRPQQMLHAISGQPASRWVAKV